MTIHQLRTKIITMSKFLDIMPMFTDWPFHISFMTFKEDKEIEGFLFNISNIILLVSVLVS